MAKFNEEYYKELEVPQFNKREVEGLSVAAVKKAINDGDIQVGTKLYEHEISFDAATSSGTGHFSTLPFHVISTRAEPYTLNDLSIILAARGVVSICDDDLVVGTGLQYDNNSSSIVTTDATSVTKELRTITNFKDVVTEL